MNIIYVLNQLLKVEMLMEQVYSYFEQQFPDEPAASALFRDLSTEEKSHADLIRLQLRTVSNNLDLFRDISYDIESLNRLMNLASEIIAGAHKPTLREALLFSLNAEKSAHELHYRTAITESNPGMGELINRLVMYDDAHSRQLEAFAKKLGLVA